MNQIDAQELVCEELYQRFEHYSWVGIYVVEGDELSFGMGRGRGDRTHDDQGRQGTRPGRGYRSHGGRARRVGTEEFIACFPTTRSEIVVPIATRRRAGEIDIDSDWLDAFDDRDRTFLEDVAERSRVS